MKRARVPPQEEACTPIEDATATGRRQARPVEAMHRFLAVHRLGEHSPEGEWKDELARLARRAHEVGIRPVETFYSADRGLAYTLYEARDPDSVRKLHEDAALSLPDDVIAAERVYTDLLR